ncbi:retrovirus-related pol polyprotein from transposon TNT 1-94 [Tanacetum coccineum]
MLEKSMYDSWASRIRLFIKEKKHGRMMLDSIDNGLLVYPTVEENGQTRPKKYSNLTEVQQLQDDCDVQATNIILHGLPPDVYALVNHQEAAKDIWDRVKMLMKGTELSYQERECRLYNLFDKFAHVQGKTLYEYYWRFSQLINDMHTIGMTMQQVQVNTKFLNALPSKWSKFVTDVKLAKSLYTTNYDQLYAYLSQHERHANEVRISRERYPDPLAFVANSPTLYNPSQSPQHSVNPQQHPVSPPPFISPLVTQKSQAKFPQLDSSLAVLMFQQGEILIECINKAMAFMSAVASRFSSSNNQLRTSSNPRNQVTIQDASQPRIVKCYNCQGERHMARQCTQPKRPRNAAWFKEKLMLAKAQEAGQILDEEQLAFLANPGISKAPVAQQTIPQNSAFQIDDFDAYDSDCDDLSSAKVVLMANLLSCDFEVLSEVPYSDSDPNDMINQDVQEMQYSEQTHIDDFHDNEIHNGSNIILYSQYLQESQDAVIQDTNPSAPNDLLVLSLVEQMTDHIAHLDKENLTNKMVNESLTTELERYKERIAIFEQRLNVDLNKRKELIDSQMDDLIRDRNAKLAAFQQEIDTLKETLSNNVKEKESLSKTLTIFKIESKEKEYRIEAPNELPKVSLVNESLKKAKISTANFDKVVKKRLTSDAITAGSWGFEHTKECFVTEVILFLKVLKDTFNAFDKTLLDEITEVHTIFNQMEAVVDQCFVDKNVFEIQIKQLRINNDQLMNQIMSQEIMHIVANSVDILDVKKSCVNNCNRCLELETKLLKKKDFIKQESVENSDLNAQLQQKIFANAALKNELRKLKRKNIVDTAVPKPNATIAPGMFKLDIEPISPRLKNNKDSHEVYIDKTIEYTDTLCGFVEHARTQNPSEPLLKSACMFTKHVQELLVYVSQTCPNSPKQGQKRVKPTTSASGLKPLGNIKNNRITRPPSINQKNKVEDHSRKVKSSLNKTNSVFEPISNALVRHYGSNATDVPSSFSLINDRLSKSYSGTVRFGNDQDANIMGYGDYQQGNVIISRVYYVEGLRHDLFSVGQFCDADLEVVFRKNTCFIRNLEGVDLLSGSRDTNLYTISLDDMLKTSPICLLSKASKTKSWLWHRRLSHLNFGTLNKLAKDGLARGILKLKFQKDHLCSACALGKSKKSSHQPKAEDANQETLYLFHMDLCGPMRVESINGKKYILVIVDDYSRFTWVKFLRSKDKASDAIIKCIKNIQVHLNVTVRNVKTDNGTKFNDVVERQNRTLVEAARTMMIFSKAPLFLWAEAINTTCYTQNRSLIRLRYNKTPYELMHDKKPDLSFFHVFGSLCYPTNDSDDLGKLNTKADIVPVATAPKTVDIANSHVSTLIDQDAPSTSILSIQEQEHSLIISPDVEESPKTPYFHDDPLHESLHEDSTSIGLSSNVRPSHTLFELLGRWTKDHPIENVIGDPSRSVSTRKQLETDAMWYYFDAFLTSVEPKNFKQEMTEPSWIDAMQEEILEFERLQVWELVPCPNKVTLIKLKWIYKDNPSHVYKLKKALNGLKQAPRAWYDMLLIFLISQHFSKGAVDPTLFTRKAVSLLMCPVYEAKLSEKHLKCDVDTRGCQDTDAVHHGKASILGDTLVRGHPEAKRGTAISKPSNQCTATFIKEQVENGIVELYFVRNEYQLDDIFSKPLPRERFNFMIEKLGMRSMSLEALKRLTEEDDE